MNESQPAAPATQNKTRVVVIVIVVLVVVCLLTVCACGALWALSQNTDKVFSNIILNI
jgi:flagellar basal body-associated protein FliL